MAARKIEVVFSEEQLQQLEQAAVATGYPTTKIIRIAVNEYLKNGVMEIIEAKRWLSEKQI